MTDRFEDFRREDIQQARADQNDVMHRRAARLMCEPTVQYESGLSSASDTDRRGLVSVVLSGVGVRMFGQMPEQGLTTLTEQLGLSEEDMRAVQTLPIGTFLRYPTPTQ